MSRSLPAISVLAGVALFGLCACGPGSGPANDGLGALAANSAHLGDSGGGTGWTLSLPASINGYPLVSNPSSASQQKMQQGLQQAEQLADISGGTPVMGAYDDTADDAWLVFVGVNGSGFDAAKLLSNVASGQAATDDGSDDFQHISAQPATVGSHGGSAICQQAVVAMDGLAVEASTCFWMTPTTFGAVALEPKDDGNVANMGIPASKVNQLMQYVRPAVEQKA